jgi:hypothetical protein
VLRRRSALYRLAGSRFGWLPACSGAPSHYLPQASGQGIVAGQTSLPEVARCGAALILFDQFVGAAEQRHWNSEAERLGGLKIDDQLEFGCSLNRQIGRLVAF